MNMPVDGVIRRTGIAVPRPPLVRPRLQARPMPSVGIGIDGIQRRPVLVPRLAVETPQTATSIPEPRDYIGERQKHSVPWKQIITGLTSATLVFGGALAIHNSRPATVTSRASTITSQANHTRTAAVAATQSAITSAVNTFAKTAEASSGVVVINLKNGVTASSNPDQVFTSASLYKLFVAEAVYRGIDNGSISPSQIVSGTQTSVQECLKLMITISDNDCGVGLGSQVSWDKQIEQLHAAGFSHTLLRADASEETSASDVALLLKRLHEGTLLSPNSTEAFINLLKSQTINNRIPQGLSAGTVVAHKTGDLDGFIHDAGIVYDNEGDYIVVALTGPWSSPGNAPATIAKLSADVNQAMHVK